jgi:hypothetical protein
MARPSGAGGKEVVGFACCVFSAVEVCAFAESSDAPYRPLHLQSTEMTFLRVWADARIVHV